MIKCQTDKFSTTVILDWVNNLLEIELTQIQQLCTGVVYCLLVDIVYPGQIQMSSIIWKAKHQNQYLSNHLLFYNALNRRNQQKLLEMRKVLEMNRLNHYILLSWMKKFVQQTNSNYRNYRAKERREGCVPEFPIYKEKGLPHKGKKLTARIAKDTINETPAFKNIKEEVKIHNVNPKAKREHVSRDPAQGLKQQKKSHETIKDPCFKSVINKQKLMQNSTSSLFDHMHINSTKDDMISNEYQYDHKEQQHKKKENNFGQCQQNNNDLWLSQIKDGISAIEWQKNEKLVYDTDIEGLIAAAERISRNRHVSEHDKVKQLILQINKRQKVLIEKIISDQQYQRKHKGPGEEDRLFKEKINFYQDYLNKLSHPFSLPNGGDSFLQQIEGDFTQNERKSQNSLQQETIYQMLQQQARLNANTNSPRSQQYNENRESFCEDFVNSNAMEHPQYSQQHFHNQEYEFKEDNIDEYDGKDEAFELSDISVEGNNQSNASIIEDIQRLDLQSLFDQDLEEIILGQRSVQNINTSKVPSNFTQSKNSFKKFSEKRLNVENNPVKFNQLPDQSLSKNFKLVENPFSTPISKAAPVSQTILPASVIQTPQEKRNIFASALRKGIQFLTSPFRRNKQQ